MTMKSEKTYTNGVLEQYIKDNDRMIEALNDNVNSLTGSVTQLQKIAERQQILQEKLSEQVDDIFESLSSCQIENGLRLKNIENRQLKTSTIWEFGKTVIVTASSLSGLFLAVYYVTKIFGG